MKYFVIVFAFLLQTSVGKAQIIDKIDGIVDKKIILRSDIESQVQLLMSQGEIYDNMHCEIFSQLAMGKLLVAQAAIDSVIVADDEVESELERKINYYISITGSKQAFEEYYGKTIDELKDDFREDIKDQLIASKMRQQVVGELEVTPSEVRAFFNQIPPDSLPYFNTEFELSQIVVYSKVSDEQREAAKSKAENLRERIIKGEEFNAFCRLYSEDLSSVKTNCELGLVPRGTFVPEFEAVAWNLKEGETSEVVETQFGFHIIQLIERKGEFINVRHILIQAQTTLDDMDLAKNKIDSVLNLLQTDTLSFFDAVKLYSDDKYSKENGGVIISNQTGGTTLQSDDIQPASDFFVIDTLEIGEISLPLIFQSEDGQSGYRIIKLDNKTAPHIANLEDDWSKIYEVAKSNKQNEVLESWIKKKARKTYIMIDDRYKVCGEYLSWANQ
jgi:peptidyl-prolyl cis-trans isomerase SurA